MKVLCRAVFVLLLCIVATSASAGEQGHYAPAAVGVRDYAMPPKGFYMLAYNPYYSTEEFRDASGNKFSSITSTGSETRDITIAGQTVPVTVSGSLTANFDIDIDVFTQAIGLAWITEHKILGADYGIFIVPSWGRTDVDVDIQTTGSGTITVGDQTRSFSSSSTDEIEDSKTGFGDLMIQPLWLGWHGTHHDTMVSYSFTAPTGAYDKDDIANVGLGFFSNRIQGNFYYYPVENKATAFMFTPTYEWNSKKIDESVQPGQDITIEYGISQYLHPRLEVAIHGYNQWQITDDDGSSASNEDVHDQVAGVGGHVSFWAIPNKCSVVGKYMHEYAVRDRLQGYFASLNVAWIF